MNLFLFLLGGVLSTMGRLLNGPLTIIFGTGETRKWVPMNPNYVRVSGILLMLTSLLDYKSSTSEGNTFLYVGALLAIIILVIGIRSGFKEKEECKDIDEA